MKYFRIISVFHIIKKLTLRVHTYPLAQLLNNMHVLELRRKMKMLRSNSLFRLFVSCKEKWHENFKKKVSIYILYSLTISTKCFCFMIEISNEDHMCLCFL